MRNTESFLNSLIKLVTGKEFISKYRTKPSYFTRNSAKLTFDKLVTYLLSLPRLSAQAAINRFIREMGYDFTMHKQSLFEAREKLSHRLFVDLNNEHFQDYFYSEGYKTYRGMRVVGVDGSVFDVPSGAKYFGTLPTAGEPVPKARVVSFTDVLNEHILRADLKPYLHSEINIAKEMLDEFLQGDIDELLLFDRGFFSREFARLLESRAKFVFRVSSASLKEINDANDLDQIIVRKDKNKPDLRLRVINFVLPTGEVEKLVTNIFDDSYTVKEFGEIYNMRWGVEISFLTLKQRLQIEDFSSAKTELILQDFHAAVFMHNLMIACINEVDSNISSIFNESKKYDYKPNKNLAIGEVRNLLIETFLYDNPRKRKTVFNQALCAIATYVVPIRNERSSPRPDNPDCRKSRKFSLNQKKGLA
jgi:hypothetical protein